MASTIRLENVRYDYAESDDSLPVRALEAVNLTIAPGDFAILMGPSGSGKSTLLNILGAVDQPTDGRMLFDDREISSLPETQLTKVRRTGIGFIFQFFNLIPTLTVRENVGFPLALQRTSGREASRRVDEVLAQIGLSGRADHFPNQLSGGEMQRVAVGRAIAHRPWLILADEPTGNLDSHTGESILELIRQIHRDYKPTVVMATHSQHASSFGDYVLEVSDGRVARRTAE